MTTLHSLYGPGYMCACSTIDTRPFPSHLFQRTWPRPLPRPNNVPFGTWTKVKLTTEQIIKTINEELDRTWKFSLRRGVLDTEYIIDDSVLHSVRSYFKELGWSVRYYKDSPIEGWGILVVQ